MDRTDGLAPDTLTALALPPQPSNDAGPGESGARRAAWPICCLGTLALWSMAAALRWWSARWAEKLPADYSTETTFNATSRSHERPFSPGVDTVATVRCRDVTLRSTGGVCIVQGDAHWLTATGAVIFETMNLYGVDR